MFLPSKKLIKWQRKDYFLTISHFILHYIIICAIIAGVIFINAGAKLDDFLNYFTNLDNIRSLLYMLVALLMVFTIIYLYFYYEFRDFLLRGKNIAVVFTVIELSLIINFAIGKFAHMHARPMALCALLILLLINKRSAIYINFCFCLMMFIIDLFANTQLADKAPIFSSLIVGATTGIIAVHLVGDSRSRIAVFLRGFILFLPILACTITLDFYNGITFKEVMGDIVYSFISGMSAVISMMAIIPVFESLFNILTNYRLAEITDHKSKLIQKMKEEAPGTFNHCLVVASLSESCASAIGENALLARAAAYYHDIGKLKQPQYFTENQHGLNPHDDLTPELSTEIIRSHTKDGYDLIKKYHLPLFLADVAREHHGTLPIQYFFMKAKKYTDGDVDIQDFSYQGPKPHTKIAAIVMLADGCEAAVRAQNDRSHSKVEKVVRGIIEDRMNNDQFSDCELTMREIDIIRKTIEDSLTGVYHDRINYPKLKVEHQNAFESEAGDKNASEATETTQKRTVKRTKK